MNKADNTTTLESRLRELEAQREGTYDKRTEHLDAEGRAIFINRLIEEDSPYLLQHAHNPVNWRPWNEESLAEAKEQNKLIFLSVGYATCHWPNPPRAPHGPPSFDPRPPLLQYVRPRRRAVSPRPTGHSRHSSVATRQ